MSHSIHQVRSFVIASPYTLHIVFEDHVEQTINLLPILRGKLYGPLRDLDFFNKVKIDPEVHTLVWPNSADFDPATLHDWPENEAAFVEMTRKWESVHT